MNVTKRKDLLFCPNNKIEFIVFATKTKAICFDHEAEKLDGF